jgi:hypothetical protein
MQNKRAKSIDSAFCRSGVQVNHAASADRAGIALIIVLGLLALMMVLGVTFAVYMRTERVAAANYSKDVVIRQLAYAAVSRAIADIDADMGARAYPAWDVLVSAGSDPVSSVTNAPAGAWIPQAVWPSSNNAVAVRVAGDTTTVLQTTFAPGWVSAANAGGANGTDYRIGYAVFNCSGLLDANYAGGANRGMGTNVQEIQVADLPEVGSDANRDLLRDGRPYETLQEMRTAGTAIGLVSPPTNLVAYSAFPRGVWDTATASIRTNIVDIGGTETALSNNRPAIISALMNCLSVPQSDADSIFENLLDYVDANNEPRNLASPDTERVPMINEVQVRVDLNFDDPVKGMCTPVVSLRVEWFYPFTQTTVENFDIAYHLELKKIGALAAPSNPPDGLVGDIEFTPNVDANRLHFSSPSELALDAPSFAYSNNAGKVVEYEVAVKLLVKDRKTGKIVDEVPSPWPSGALTNHPPGIVVPLVAPSAGSLTAVDGFECNDPRFNWDAVGTGMQQWYSYADVRAETGDSAATNGSLNEMNRYTTWYWGSTDGATSDRHGYMHVANGPLQTVGEISCLLRGREDSSLWRTIRLYRESADIQVDPVLDWFSIGAQVAVGKGYVNPNTHQADVLRTLLMRTPLDKYPGEANATLLDVPLLDSVIAEWERASEQNGPIRNLSELGNMTNIFAVSGIASMPPLQKEAWLRNTAGLLNLRQQYFMILVFVETARYVPQIGRTRLGRMRALAEVWRDPYPEPGDHHPTLLRMFRILNEE